MKTSRFELVVLLLGTVVAPRSVSSFAASIGKRKCTDINPPSSAPRETTPYTGSRFLHGGAGVGGGERRTHAGRGRYSALPAAAAVPRRLAVVGSAVGAFYKSYPALASFLTAAILAAAADGYAQHADECVKKFDAKRNVAMILYSGIVSGVCVEFMYSSVFPIIFGADGAGGGGMHRAIRMTLFDECVNAPLLWLPPAYVAQAVVYRTSKRSAMRKYLTDVREHGLLTKYWSLWIPMSIINFSVVPLHFRVAFVAVVSFFWMIILSVVANRSSDIGGDLDEAPREKICPTEPSPINPRAWWD
jgi:protein Mpv17